MFYKKLKVSNKGLKKQAKRELSRAQMLRMRVKGGIPAVFGRLPHHHEHVSMSY
jgi:hypothetical protein